MCKRKFESEYFKKNPIQPPNGVLLICKLPMGVTVMGLAEHFGHFLIALYRMSHYFRSCYKKVSSSSTSGSKRNKNKCFPSLKGSQDYISMIKEHLDTQLNDEKANHRKKVFQLDTRNEQMRKKRPFSCC